MQPDEKCALEGCPEERIEGGLFCGSQGRRHMTDHWMGRIRRLSDGSYVGSVGPQSREPEPFVPEWRRHLVAKDMTRAA